jgi:hydrogenase/urease accessory protein HupE
MMLSRPAMAHEIPERVAVRAFVQREDSVLRVLVRVPLDAIRDVDFPLRDDGTLDLVRVRTLLPEAAQVWLANSVGVEADGVALGMPHLAGARIALPQDRSFAQFTDARASFAQPLLDAERVAWQQLSLDVALEYALPARAEHLVLRPTLAHLGIRTVSIVTIVAADGTERVLTYAGNPGAISLAPRWYSTGAQFFLQGVQHILGGLDHLLFVLCLILPLQRMQPLIAIVTAFTVGHSLTLGATAFGVAPRGLWFPPLVETLIAASIVWLTIENVLRRDEQLAARWPVAFMFGLVHGFGFSFALGETLQFAGANQLTALVSFNFGVEAGQLAALAVAVPVLMRVRRWIGTDRTRVVTIVGSVLVAHTAWHWMTDRAAQLATYRGSLAWPTFDAALALVAVRVALLLAVAIAAALAMRQIFRVPRRS